MPDSFTDLIRTRRDEQRRKAEETRKHLESLVATASGSSRVASKLDELNAGLRNVARSDDITSVVDSIGKMNVAAFTANKEAWAEVVSTLGELTSKVQKTVDKIEKDSSKRVEKSFSEAINRLDDTIKRLKSVKIESDGGQKEALQGISAALASLDVKPVVNVPAPIVNLPEPSVTVNEKEVDFTPLVEILGNVDQGISKLAKAQPKLDTSDLKDSIGSVEKAINRLINKPVPVPTVPLPFKNASNKGVQALVNDDGSFISGGTLVTKAFDYISAAYPNATTETYTYKLGGAGGTTVATVTVTYTTSTKDLISTVTRT